MDWAVDTRDGVTLLVDAEGQPLGRVGDEVAVTGGYVSPASLNAISRTGDSSVFAAHELRVM